MKSRSNADNRKRMIVRMNISNTGIEEGKEEISGSKQTLSLMKYWFQHRLEENSMNQLIFKI